MRRTCTSIDAPSITRELSYCDLRLSFATTHLRLIGVRTFRPLCGASRDGSRDNRARNGAMCRGVRPASEERRRRPELLPGAARACYATARKTSWLPATTDFASPL